ncbi:MAG: hypothetical protein JW874_09435, partial [Spirochaetales bacterium]|nr:hypothetical protein [Spirochaetales bacterium]
IIINIPCLGENLNSELNIRVDTYNQQLKSLCTRQGKILIDVNEWQKQIIRNKNKPSDYFIPEEAGLMLADSLLSFWGLSTFLSGRRGLSVTIDGVHMNHAGAKGLAALVLDKLV